MSTKEWTRAGPYEMRSGPWTIAREFVDGCSLYLVSKQGTSGCLAAKNDFDEAKEWIDENVNQVIGGVVT